MNETAPIPAIRSSHQNGHESASEQGFGGSTVAHRAPRSTRASTPQTDTLTFGHVLLALLVLLTITLGIIATDPPKAQAAPAWTPATATWYGPGLYGNTTACGQTYTIRLRGTAHMSLPCGAKVTICKPVGRFRRCVMVRVIDRGAFHPGNFDLSARTAMDLCRCWRPYTQRVSWRKGWAA